MMLHRAWVPLLAWLAIAGGSGAGCSGAPTEEDARAWFASSKTMVRGIDQELRQDISKLQPGHFHCRIDVARPGLDPDVNPEAFAAHCKDERARWLEKRGVAWSGLEATKFPEYLERPGLLGLTIKCREKDTVVSNNTLCASTGLTTPGSKERVEATKGFTSDPYHVGWGKYQTAFRLPQADGNWQQVGDDEAHEGLEVAWSFDDGDETFDVLVFVLTEHQTDAKWRAVFRKRARDTRDE